MQKRNRTAEASNTGRGPRRSTAVPNPDLISTDLLGTMQDEDLLLRLRALEEDCNRAYESGRDTYPWEVEIAYVRREQQIRRGRRDVHARLTAAAQVEFDRIEAALPQGDFDNSTFVYAASGGRPRWN